jgi:hypothetical protein
VPEFIDPVFVKTSPKRSFSMTKNERFRLVFVKTGSINSGTGQVVGKSNGDKYWGQVWETGIGDAGTVLRTDIRDRYSIEDRY